MTKENYKISKIQIGFYYLLMFLILIWFLVIQFTGINNHNARIQSSDITYRGTFTWIHSDGSKEQIAVPGHYNVPAKETMVITTTLPENYTQSSLAIRSSLQDIRFYIDGVLRNTQPKTSGWLGKILPAVMFSVLLQQQMQEKNSVLS